jgi:hypothetical protein
MKRNLEPFSSYSNLLRFLFLISILSLIGCAIGIGPSVNTTLGTNFQSARIMDEPVAVVPSQPSQAGNFFADLISGELLGAGFRIIERVHLEAMLREHQLTLTGLLEKQDYLQLGKMTNVRRMFIVSALSSPKMGDISNANLKLVDLNTGEVLMSTVYDNPFADAGSGYKYQNKEKSAKVIVNSIREKIGK